MTRRPPQRGTSGEADLRDGADWRQLIGGRPGLDDAAEGTPRLRADAADYRQVVAR
jgi:hypothetical protein